MIYNWVNPDDYTMDTLLLLDRWVIRCLMAENAWYNEDTRDYKTDMAKALNRYPHVAEFCRRKAPECKSFIDQLPPLVPDNLRDEEAHRAEVSLLDALETFVVYAYPEVMDRVNYIRNWDAQNLYNLVDLTDKVVLDVGAGTGRLSFAAAGRAKRVYASEPCDTLRSPVIAPSQRLASMCSLFTNGDAGERSSPLQQDGHNKAADSKENPRLL